MSEYLQGPQNSQKPPISGPLELGEAIYKRWESGESDMSQLSSITPKGYEDYLASTDRPFTEADVKLVNALHFAHSMTIKPQSEWGAYRTEGGIIRGDSPPEESFMGDVVKRLEPTTYEETSAKMKDILSRLNADGGDPVETVSDTIWEFVLRTHPMFDRNKRTSVTLSNAYLRRRGLPRLEFSHHEREGFLCAIEEKNPALYHGRHYIGEGNEDDANDAYRRTQLRKFIHTHIQSKTKD